MAFKSLINQSSPAQLAHKIHGLIQLYKNKHHLNVTSPGMGRSRLLASAIADILVTGSKIYLLVNSNKEDMLLRVAAALTDLSYKDLKNPTYRNKPEIQEKLKAISNEYDTNIEVDAYFNGVTSKQVVQQINEKHKNGFKCEYVFIEDIGLMADENEYAKQMNQAVSNLNSLAEALGVSIVSYSSIASTGDIPGYLLNQDSDLVMFTDPPYKGSPDFIICTKDGQKILVEMKESMRVGKTAINLELLKKMNPGFDFNKKFVWIMDESHGSGKSTFKDAAVAVQLFGRYSRMNQEFSATPIGDESQNKSRVLKYQLEACSSEESSFWAEVAEIATKKLVKLSNKHDSKT